MITFNQAHTEKVEYMLDYLDIKGFTLWEEVLGRGTATGEPRMGTHTWPEKNSAILAVVNDEKVTSLLTKIKMIDEIAVSDDYKDAQSCFRFHEYMKEREAKKNEQRPCFPVL